MRNENAFAGADRPAYRGHVLDLNTGGLRRDHVLVQSTAIGDVFIGFGTLGGRLMDFAFGGKKDSGSLLAHCDAIDQALKARDLAKVRALGASEELGAIADPHLRRLAIAELVIGKASADDPEHPGWPAGTPGGVGGRYRPKDQDGDRQESTEERIRRLAAREQLRDGALALLKFLATLPLDLIPVAGEFAEFAQVTELARAAIELNNSRTQVEAAVDFVRNGPYCLDDLRVSPDSESFSSMYYFRKISRALALLIKRFGSAGAGNEYHHIVTQGGDNDKNISAEQLHSTDNVIPLPRLLHEVVNGVYQGPYENDPGLTLYEWLQTQPYEIQRAEGIKVLQDLGIINPDCGDK